MRLALNPLPGIRTRMEGRAKAGVLRFLLYLSLQFGVFMLGGPYLVLPGLLILGLGAKDGLSWLAWARASWPVLIMAGLPALVGFPLSPILEAAASGASISGIAPLWIPSLARSARFLMVFASAAWLSRGMSPADLRDVLTVLLRPLGRRFGGGVARSASLAMAFLPWTITEIQRADEAARLRGSKAGCFPVRHLAAMAVPVSVRALEKARLSAEALELRSPGLPAGPGVSCRSTGRRLDVE